MIKELVNKLIEVAESHLMIKSTGYGDNWDIQKSENLYPNFFIEWPFNITYENSVKRVSLSWYITDLPGEDQKDCLDLLNKVEQINEDILIRLTLGSYGEWNSIGSLNAVTLTEWMGDNVVGIRQEITFNILRTSNNCESPFKN